MAINLASKYEKKVAERFTHQSVTDSHAGDDYEFTGVQSIKIYTVDTVDMTDYSRTGTNRFGNLSELGDTIQELTITRDRAFTFSIDQGNAKQSYNIKQATKCLRRQVDEVVTPEIDMYRLSAWAAGAGESKQVAAPTKSNVLEMILTASMNMNNLLVPRANRALFIKESVYLYCKLADQIVGVDRLGEKAIAKGSVGMIDSMNVIPVPDSYFPEGVYFLIKYKGCTVDPVQLKTYRVLKNQRGVDGDVVEGRVIYDSFVIDTRKNGIFVAKA